MQRSGKGIDDGPSGQGHEALAAEAAPRRSTGAPMHLRPLLQPPAPQLHLAFCANAAGVAIAPRILCERVPKLQVYNRASLAQATFLEPSARWQVMMRRLCCLAASLPYVIYFIEEMRSYEFCYGGG